MATTHTTTTTILLWDDYHCCRHLNVVPSTTTSTTPMTHFAAVNNKIEDYDDAFAIIDECAQTGKAHPDLYNAIHWIEKNGHRIYPQLHDQMELWKEAHGSWKLQLSTGDPHNHVFHKPPKFLPPFSFAMIDETHFGNGIGWNEHSIWLSLLDEQTYRPQHRRMEGRVGDVYLFGHSLRPLLLLAPAWLRNTIPFISRTE